MILEEISGLTIVHPVDRIKEVVELEWNRIEQQKSVVVKESVAAYQETKEGVAVCHQK